MRNLIDFISRYHAYLLFLLLQGISFWLIIHHHRYHNAGFFNSASLVSGSIYSAVGGIREYVMLKRINERLAAENAYLRQLVSSTNLLSSSDNVSQCIEESAVWFAYIPAKVVNNPTVKAGNFITLNKGTRHGVRKETGVISREGVVGIVIDVSDNFSLVMSLLHKKSNISVRLKKARFIGNVNWDGGSVRRVRVTGVPVNAWVETGDTLVTSGFSSIFPENIPVGRIVRVESTAASNFFEIEAELFTNFHTLDYVYIINQPLQDEQRKLETIHE